MNYTGKVTPGGRTALRRTPLADIRKVSVGPLDNNAYLLTCRATGAQLLIDAAAEPERLMDLVREGSPDGRLDVIATTHCHLDHIGALWDVAEETRAQVVAGAGDADAIERVTTRRVERELVDGDLLAVGDVEIAVVALRGHTPGSIALVLEGPDRTHVFTGDSLFPGGLGNTDKDPERFSQLYTDATTRLFDRFGDDTWVYPGHGADTTLGAERGHLGEWWDRGW